MPAIPYTVYLVSGEFSRSGNTSEFASIDYLLAKKALLREFKAGQIAKHELCDAHPELIRAAKSIGMPSGELCEVCGSGDIVHVSYAFGPKLPSHGRCISGSDELARLRATVSQFTCYVVEVCPECHWNHLVRQF